MTSASVRASAPRIAPPTPMRRPTRHHRPGAQDPPARRAAAQGQEEAARRLEREGAAIDPLDVLDPRQEPAVRPRLAQVPPRQHEAARRRRVQPQRHEHGPRPRDQQEEEQRRRARRRGDRQPQEQRPERGHRPYGERATRGRDADGDLAGRGAAGPGHAGPARPLAPPPGSRLDGRGGAPTIAGGAPPFWRAAPAQGGSGGDPRSGSSEEARGGPMPVAAKLDAGRVGPPPEREAPRSALAEPPDDEPRGGWGHAPGPAVRVIRKGRSERRRVAPIAPIAEGARPGAAPGVGIRAAVLPG